MGTNLVKDWFKAIVTSYQFHPGYMDEMRDSYRAIVLENGFKPDEDLEQLAKAMMNLWVETMQRVELPDFDPFACSDLDWEKAGEYLKDALSTSCPCGIMTILDCTGECNHYE